MHKGKKYSTIVPSHRMSSLVKQHMCLIFDEYTTTSPHHVSSLILQQYNKIAFNKYNGKYSCTINCIIASVIIVLSLTVIFFVKIIALLQYSFSFSQFSCSCCGNIINTLVCINTDLFYFNSYLYRVATKNHKGDSYFSSSR